MSGYDAPARLTNHSGNQIVLNYNKRVINEFKSEDQLSYTVLQYYGKKCHYTTEEMYTTSVTVPCTMYNIN
jgi:hypothetical protein